MYKSKTYRSKHSANATEMWQRSEHVQKLGSIRSSSDYREKRRKIAISIAKQRSKDGTLSCFNVEACKFIDALNFRMGWNLRHALNGGEFEVGGFMVDGYDKTKGIVFEYDEPHHFRNGNLRKEDQHRQDFLIQRLHPSMFVRYNEIEGRLVDVISGREMV